MYFTVEDINTLDSIISDLNTIENEKEQKEFLDKYVEDPELFLEMVKKVKKCRYLTKQVKCHRSNLETYETDLYSEDEIKSIFSAQNNETIMQGYSLADLQAMYISVYKKNHCQNVRRKR